MLSKFTKPQHLFWASNEVAALFGEDMNRYFAPAAEGVGLVFAGVATRPLHKYMVAHTTGDVCMIMAHMTPFLQISAGRAA